MSRAESPFVTEPGHYWDQVLHLGTVRRYPAGSYIYQQGERSEHFYYLLRGRIKVSISRPDGSEKILAIMEQRTVLGESASLDGLPYYASAQALVESEVCALPREAVLAAAIRNPQLLQELLRGVVRKQRLLAMQVESMAFLRAPARIALILARLATDYGVPTPDGRGKRLGIRLTQDELANMLGTSRVTVARVIGNLLRQGVLERRKWDLVVVDEQRLWQLASDGQARPGDRVAGTD